MSDATPPDLIAKRAELDNIVAELDIHFDANHYDIELDDIADRWWQTFGTTASPLLNTARDAYLRDGQGFPDIDTFRAYVECAADFAALQVTSNGACRCDNGWAPAPPVMRGRYRYDNQYRPCPQCRPEQADKHRTEWAPHARRTAPVQPDDVTPFNPLAVVQAERVKLAAVTRSRLGYTT